MGGSLKQKHLLRSVVVLTFIVLRTFLALRGEFSTASAKGNCHSFADHVYIQEGVNAVGQAVCKPDGKWATIGHKPNSFIILDMGRQNEIVDQPGTDLILYSQLNDDGSMAPLEVSVSPSDGNGNPVEFVVVFIWNGGSHDSEIKIDIADSGETKPDALYQFVRIGTLPADAVPSDEDLVYVDTVENSYSLDIATPIPTEIQTAEYTPTPPSTETLTPLVTDTPSNIQTYTASVTPSQVKSLTQTPTDITTLTSTPTLLGVPTQTPTITITATSTRAVTFTSTQTSTPTNGLTVVSEPSSTRLPTITPSPNSPTKTATKSTLPSTPDVSAKTSTLAAIQNPTRKFAITSVTPTISTMTQVATTTMTDRPAGDSTLASTPANISTDMPATTATSSPSTAPMVRSPVIPLDAWERFWKSASDLSEWGKPGTILTVLAMLAAFITWSVVKVPAFWNRLFEKAKNRFKFVVFRFRLKWKI